MEFIVAKSAGFCFGVKRAIDSVQELLKEKKADIYSTGPIIHNEIVTKDLKSKGLHEILDINEISKLENKDVIIRTHGIEKGIRELLTKNGNKVIDLTCPFVSKIHRLVEDYSKNGYKIIVIGDKEHPEVKGIVSYSYSDIFVIISEEDIKSIKIDNSQKVLIVFQTTTNVKNAEKLVDILKKLFYNYKLVDTICNATQDRQDEVIDISGKVDVMLIIGSKTSSNTKKLYEIAKMHCKNTYFISDKEDTKSININKNSKIGVSAGASTPEYLIEEILDNVRNEF